MRVLLSTIGSRGDVQPLVALALQLRACGHQARLCVPPDFRDWITDLGFEVMPIGPELRAATAAPRSSPASSLLSPERRRQLAEATVAAQFETVAVAADGCDAIVAATALQMAARSVAETRRIPYAFAAYCPIVLPSLHHAPPPLPPVPGLPPAPATSDNRELWARDAERFNNLFGPALNIHRGALGLAPVEDVRRHIFGDCAWLAADATLAPWPEPGDATVFQPGAWVLQDDRLLPEDVERFLDAGPPPLYFGFGSMRAPAELGRAVVASTRALGRRAIVSRGWADLWLVDAGPDCLAVGEINVRVLFTRVAAAVHHGGAGTTTLAALAGVPQVVVPHLYDQHYWARRISELGIGAAHSAAAPTADSLATAADAALRSEIAERARSIAASIRQDGAELAVERLVRETSPS